MSKKRMIGFDIFRCISAVTVLLFHQQMHLGCSYVFFNRYINMGAVFMTGFFMLSGYVLYYVYFEKDFSQISDLIGFYLKRIAGLMPLYYVTAFFFVIFWGSESIKQNLILLPVEILGLQALFPGLSSKSHNGGTWFISCLIICYVLFPFAQQLIKQINDIWKLVIEVIAVCILLWSPFVVLEFGLADIYSNPAFRQKLKVPLGFAP